MTLTLLPMTLDKALPPLAQFTGLEQTLGSLPAPGMALGFEAKAISFLSPPQLFSTSGQHTLWLAVNWPGKPHVLDPQLQSSGARFVQEEEEGQGQVSQEPRRVLLH